MRHNVAPVTPGIEFHSQGVDEEAVAAAFIEDALGSPSISSFEVVVAWVRFGALARLEAAFRDFAARGGACRLIVGIDEGGATRPGLRKALDLFDTVHVMHDPSGRTFHPKIYLAEGPEAARLLVGSSNATPGGLYFNYEASLSASFDLPGEADAEALVGVKAFIEALRDDSEVCIELTEGSFEGLASDPRYRIAATERRVSKKPAVEPPEGVEEDEVDSIVEDSVGSSEPLFGRSKYKRPPVPPLSAEAKAELRALEDEGDAEQEGQMDTEVAPAPPPTSTPPSPVAPPATPSGPAPAAPAGSAVAEAWSKELSRADAQQPTASGTNPTGVLRLSKAGHPINHRRWFRDRLFGPAAWNAARDRRGNPIEVAQVPVEVNVMSTSLGTIDLQVDHAPHREAGQNNVPTILHWGDQLGQELRGTDHSGRQLELERMTDGSYRLTIS